MTTTTVSESQPVLSVRDLHVRLPHRAGIVHAVRGVSFDLQRGETVCIVGESGCGKSMSAMAILNLLPRGAKREAGAVSFLGEDVLNAGERRMSELRGDKIGMIFQEPLTALNPSLTVGEQLMEVFRRHRPARKGEARERALEMLGQVGIPNPSERMSQYPHQLSGGLRQRVVIAMALMCEPIMIIADEPTTALDVTIQAQILELLRDLQHKLGMAMLLITHDLGVVANMADEVVVIYHGEIMEAGPVKEIFRNPQHPYLKGLMAAVPHFDMKPGERLKALRDVPVNLESLIGKKKTVEADAPQVLLSVNNLSKTYTTRKRSLFGQGERSVLRAVDDVSFDIKRGECLGLVGESGCGKTTVSKILMRAITPDTGSVVFNDGKEVIDVLSVKGDALQELRTKIQMVFQDPVSSLSPRMTVRNILSEPLEIHDRGDSEERSARSRR